MVNDELASPPNTTNSSVPSVPLWCIFPSSRYALLRRCGASLQDTGTCRLLLPITHDHIGHEQLARRSVWIALTGSNLLHQLTPA